MKTTIEDLAFAPIKKETRRRFDALIAKGTKVFAVAYDRDEIWQTYLNGFTDADERQEHNCGCCRSFIRQIGAAVVINEELKVESIWDKDSPSPGVRALAEYIESRPIAGLFYHEQTTGGTDRTPDPKRGVVWEHFFVKVPDDLVNNGRGANVLGKKSATVRETKGVMQRGFDEITAEAISTVQELIAQNSLYRGAESKHMVDQFDYLRSAYVSSAEDKRDALCWQFAAQQPENVCRIRNTAIGTLLCDLSAGGFELEDCVKAFEVKVAPTNYKRPTALVTPRMVEAAKKQLESLDLISALDRRRLDERDLTVANALYVYRPTVAKKDVFAQLGEDQPVNVKELSKVEEIGIDDFLAHVVPTAKDIKVLVERQHLGNFVTLTGAVDPEANNLMKWDNSFGWSYTGGVADSIKERVKDAGGKVDGWMRASLAWFNHDDLDLHFISDREHVYFAQKRGHEAWLDVDMNAGGGSIRTPVENITIDYKLAPGNYKIRVYQFHQREYVDAGYDLEIEVNGETHVFGNAKSPRSGAYDDVTFKVMADGQVTFGENALTKNTSSTTKWGVTTGKFTRVRAITLSPNHWTKPVMNKHFMFLLEGAVSDEPTRPFYNEFLVDALSKDRKTTEAIAGKIEVAPAQGAELSGLGFSDTKRNHLFVEVLGTFKRTLKVLF